MAPLGLIRRVVVLDVQRNLELEDEVREWQEEGAYREIPLSLG